MNASTRVVINTSAQTVRTLITVIITLYTSRVVLTNLGVEDFGIFSLIGGVVALLGFIQNNLSRTTQRYLSYHHGDVLKLIKIFDNSLLIHVIFAIAICCILLLLTNVVLTRFINLPEYTIGAAKWVYWLTIGSLFVNMLSTPFLAVLISRENIIFSSIIQVIDAILKVPIALSIARISNNRLEWYSFMLLCIVILNFLCYYAYCRIKYDECKHFSIKVLELRLCKEILSFMGWNVYATACTMGRTQGIAILLNRFFGASINAAFGISGQVSSQVGFLSSALTTAINPQIIKAEGEGNRKKMFRLSEISCKFSFLLMSIVTVPAIIYMPTILELWLGKVPEYTTLFCVSILIANQIDLLTLNLNTTNQAIGNVKIYSICINSIKILTIPFAWVVLDRGMQPQAVMIVYIIFESLCAIARLWFLHISVRLSIYQYFKNVLICILPPLIINFTMCYFLSPFFEGWGILVTAAISVSTTCIITYLIGLKNDELQIINYLLGKIIRVLRK